MRHACSGALLGALALLATGAHHPSQAQAQQGRDPVAADALFREARDLLKDAKFNEACPKLAESFRLDPAPGTLYNLAECEEKRGRTASALERWRSLVDLLTATGKLTDARLPAAKQRIATLTQQAPALSVRIKPGAPAETIVLRDAVELRGASLGIELPVDPGEHVVIARAAYRRDGVFRFTLKEGEHKTLEVEPGPPDGAAPGPASSGAGAPPRPTTGPSATAAPTAPPSASVSTDDLARPNTRRTIGLVVGGVGVASLIGAGVTGLILTGKKSTVDDNCNPDTKRCNPEGLEAVDSIKTLNPINLALWVVGAAGVGAGAYLFFTAPTETRPQVSFSTSGSQSSLWLTGRFLTPCAPRPSLSSPSSPPSPAASCRAATTSPASRPRTAAPAACPEPPDRAASPPAGPARARAARARAARRAAARAARATRARASPARPATGGIL